MEKKAKGEDTALLLDITRFPSRRFRASAARESNLGTTDGLRVSQFFKLLRHNTGNQLYVPS